MKVRAIRKGYFGLMIREAGDEFDIQDNGDFSAKWMEKVGSAKAAPTETEAPQKKTSKTRVSDESKI